jgi:small subunit ribosomal protein S17
MTETRGKRRELLGKVVSNKMEKTVVVVVERRIKHARYKKYLLRRTRYKAHDEENTCNVGDMVVLRETRPMSKEKRWCIASITNRATI